MKQDAKKMKRNAKRKKSQKTTRRSRGLGAGPDEHGRMAEAAIEDVNRAVGAAKTSLQRGACTKAVNSLIDASAALAVARDNRDRAEEKPNLDRTERNVKILKSQVLEACVVD